MRMTAMLAAALAAATLLGACAREAAAPADEAPATRRFGQIGFEPCSLRGTSGGNATPAYCARHEVAEDPAAGGGRRIALNVAWLPATSQGGGSEDPVFFLAGGPGQAATEHAATVVAALADVRKTRDIVLVDQRGTGQSNALACLQADGEPMQLEQAAPSAEDYARFARACAQTLADRADPRLYTTTEAVADLEAVRAALQVEKINLIGVSYGTRVAQQYAARHPQHVRTMVLDGVAPNDLVVGGEFASTLEDALALQSAHCARLPECRARFGSDMRVQLRQVIARLKAAPVEVDFRDPATGQAKRDEATEHTVAGLAFAFSYAPQTASLLPLMLDEAANGRYGPLMSLSQMMAGEMAGQMTQGMQWSVICAEDAPRYRARPGAEDTVLGEELATMFFAPCQSWPTGTAPANFHAPLQSSLPVLLLSGEIDPVTPPRYAERVLQGLSNGRHFMLPGQGHNVLGVGCMPKLIGQFLETADPTALKAECLDTVTYVPPFVSFNGWAP
ncbi:MAG: alpha/beta hydrolase [Pseudomonadota bacterium]|nr:alpha/beta hydrolase [Pseudomonadota bacterium]